MTEKKEKEQLFSYEHIGDYYIRIALDIQLFIDRT